MDEIIEAEEIHPDDIGPIPENVPNPSRTEVSQPGDLSVSVLRRSAYIEESDPLFFKWQRGEATEEAWLEKIAEIKERFPKDSDDPD